MSEARTTTPRPARRWPAALAILAAGAALAVIPATYAGANGDGAPGGNAYEQTNLVSDVPGAARLTDGERDAGVGTHVGLLERDGVGLVLRNEIPYSLEDRQQPRVEPLPRGRPPAPRHHRLEAPVASVDDPVPACSRSWVDAEDLHRWKLRGSPDVPSSKITSPIDLQV